MKGPTNVFFSFAPRQISLSNGVTDPAATAKVDRRLPRPGDRTCQLERLVKASFPKAQRVQGQGDDQVRPGTCAQQRKLSTKVTCESQAMPILERLNQFVNWKAIAKGGEGRIVMWWRGETSTTDFALWCRQGASWTALRRQLRQVVLTGLAEETGAAFCTTQQAVLR
jgi:hypothetical protein